MYSRTVVQILFAHYVVMTLHCSGEDEPIN